MVIIPLSKIIWPFGPGFISGFCIVFHWFVYLYASTTLFWLLWLCSKLWNLVGWDLQLGFSFSSLFYLFWAPCNSILIWGLGVSHSVVSNSLWSHGLQPAWLLCPWDSLSKNTGVDCHFLLQRTFPTQGLTQVSYIAGRFSTIWAMRIGLSFLHKGYCNFDKDCTESVEHFG